MNFYSRCCLCLWMQVLRLKDQYSDTITDMLPGVEYLIQLRTRDEYDGEWSDWSAPVCAHSWTGECTPPHTHTRTITRPNLDLSSHVFSSGFHQTSPDHQCSCLVWCMFPQLPFFFSLKLKIVWIFIHRGDQVKQFYSIPSRHTYFNSRFWHRQKVP